MDDVPKAVRLPFQGFQVNTTMIKTFPLEERKFRARIMRQYGIDVLEASDEQLMSISIDSKEVALDHERAILKLKEHGELTTDRQKFHEAGAILARQVVKEISRILILRFQERGIRLEEFQRQQEQAKTLRRELTSWLFMAEVMRRLGRDEAQKIWDDLHARSPEFFGSTEIPDIAEAEKTANGYIQKLENVLLALRREQAALSVSKGAA